MPSERAINEVRVGGHLYRVQSSANSEELARLAADLDARLNALPKAQRSDPKSLVLVALGLAHDLDQERSERSAERRATEQRLTALLQRIDSALDHVDEFGEPLPSSSPAAR